MLFHELGKASKELNATLKKMIRLMSLKNMKSFQIQSIKLEEHLINYPQ